MNVNEKAPGQQEPARSSAEKQEQVRLAKNTSSGVAAADAQPQAPKETEQSDGQIRHVHFVSARDFLRKPLVRQFLHRGHFYEAIATKTPSRFELFFDLVVVAMLYQLGQRVAEDFHATTLALFLVVYAPVYSIWNDVRVFTNVCGCDDVVQRLGILLYMGLLLGYAANAASLRMPSQRNIEADPPSSTGPEHTSAAIQRLAAITPVETVAFATLQATIGFLVVAKLIRLVQQLIYAVWLPRFRISFLLSSGQKLLSIGIYLPLIWVRNEAAFWVLMALGAVHEFGLSFAQMCVWRYAERSAKWLEIEEGAFRPALHLDHHIERDALFLVLVLGESLLKIIYLAQGSSIGVSNHFGRAVLALICSFCICNLVFDMDASHVYIHALRRHWLSSVCFNHMMYPLSSSIILWASSLVAMVPMQRVQGQAQWYFAEGLAATLLCMGICGSLHRSMDVPGSPLVPRPARLGMRIVWAVIIALLPLSDTLADTTYLLAVSACLLLVLTGFEIVGKVGARSQSFKSAPNGVRLEDLTDSERGEEDVGIEGGLGDVEKQEIPLRQRLAWSA